MSTFKRVFCLGLTSDGEVWVSVEVGHRNGPEDELSFTGVIGPKSNGDARGSCGQIDMSEWNFLSLKEGWTEEMVSRLRDLWSRWHLNRMQAGTPKQMAFVRALGDRSTYDETKAALTEAGLQPDPETGYSYGSAWLAEDVPPEVYEELLAMPEATIRCPWRDFN